MDTRQIPGSARAAHETPEVEMDEHAVVTTRRCLHALAERLLAGPQYLSLIHI